MIDHEQQILRARQAAELLEHPMLVEAFAALDHEVIEAWKSSPVRDEAGREKLWMMLQLAQKVRKRLISHVETGKLSAEELKFKEARSLLQRVKEF